MLRTRIERPCTVADQFCDQPANLEHAYTRGTCVECGLPVCTKCSIRRADGRHCHECLVTDGRGRLVANHLWRLAGYAGRPPAYLLAALGAS